MEPRFGGGPGVDGLIPVGTIQDGGITISSVATVDFGELEARVTALAKEHRRLRHENASLRESLGARDGRVRQLEEEIRDLNQRRQDVAKRLDELIHRIGRLDAQLAAGQARAGAKA